MKYKFQFNNDAASCIALMDLIKEGWSVCGYEEDVGYSWLILKRNKL